MSATIPGSRARLGHPGKDRPLDRFKFTVMVLGLAALAQTASRRWPEAVWFLCFWWMLMQ